MYEQLIFSGKFKILFFFQQESGRVIQQDVTTMKLVLDSAQEIDNRYGVIVNKVRKNMLKKFKNEDVRADFLSTIFAGIDENRRCETSNVTFLSNNEDLEEEDNAFVNHSELKTFQGISFKVCQ